MKDVITDTLLAAGLNEKEFETMPLVLYCYDEKCPFYATGHVTVFRIDGFGSVDVSENYKQQVVKRIAKGE